MKQTYKITGMTCQGCVKQVTETLEAVEAVEKAEVDLAHGIAQLSLQQAVAVEELQENLSRKGAYTIAPVADVPTQPTSPKNNTVEEAEAEQVDYRRLYPLLLVFSYLIGFVLLSQLIAGRWNSMQAMQYFMGGFFVVFSFFKLLDLRGFAYSFSTYDLLAKRWLGYAYIYPFIELALGIAYLIGAELLTVNLITLSIVTIGTIGVAQAVFNKRAIQCACLGTVFNLPMTKVTLTENSIMIVMALGMIASLV